MDSMRAAAEDYKFLTSRPTIRQSWADLGLHHNDLHQLDVDGKCVHLSTSKPTEYWIEHQSTPDLLEAKLE